MPYIPQQDRAELDYRTPNSVGELTYALTRVIERYLAHTGVRNFATFGEVMWALEASKLEFYRRVVAPYETRKREENGDVYV